MEDEEKKGPRPSSYMTLSVPSQSISSDALSLVVHHIRRQASLSSDEKTRLKRILFSLLPKLMQFKAPASCLSLDDEDSASDSNKGTLELFIVCVIVV